MYPHKTGITQTHIQKLSIELTIAEWLKFVMHKLFQVQKHKLRRQ